MNKFKIGDYVYIKINQNKSNKSYKIIEKQYNTISNQYDYYLESVVSFVSFYETELILNKYYKNLKELLTKF